MAVDEVSLAALRRRSSGKWRTYPSDVLPAWVAEMDFTLTEPIAHALRGAGLRTWNHAVTNNRRIARM